MLTRLLGMVLASIAFAGSVAPGVVLAQGEGGAGINAAVAATEPSWVAPYGLVILGAGLGIYVIGKPSKRKGEDDENSGPV